MVSELAGVIPAVPVGLSQSRDDWEDVRLIKINGVRLCVSRRGPSPGTSVRTRPPLLMLMGLGAGYQMWDPLRTALARRLPDLVTLAYDAPGAGYSSTTAVPLSLHSLAKMASRLMGRLGHQRFDVLGFSWGGLVAQELALHAPSQIGRLVLAATTPGMGGIPGSPTALAVLASPWRYYDRYYLQHVMPLLYGGRARQPSTSLRQQVTAHTASPPSLCGYLWQLAALAGWSSLRRLPLITAPTLVLAGDDDPITPPANATLIASRIPSARLHLLPEAGHLLVIDSIDEITPLLVDFLWHEGRTEDRGGQPSAATRAPSPTAGCSTAGVR